MLHSEIATDAVPQKPDCRHAVVIGGSIAG
ncbi:hypothetical protein NUACC26_084090 [Scytonema sp. NUACC26]